LDTVEDRHADVHQYDVGLTMRNHEQRFRTDGGFGNNVDVVGPIEQRPKARAHERLVVDEHDANHWRTASSGIHARTSKPPPGAASAVSRPPSARTRSRIPVTP